MPRYPIFLTAIDSVFKSWTALTLAVEHGQPRPKPGPNRRVTTITVAEFTDWLTKVVEDFFYSNDGVVGYDVADFLEGIMDAEFQTVVDDGSLEEIGNTLCSYYKFCEDKKEAELFAILEKLKTEGSQVHAASVANSKQLEVEPVLDAEAAAMETE